MSLCNISVQCMTFCNPWLRGQAQHAACGMWQGGAGSQQQDAAHLLRSLNRTEPDYDPSECVRASGSEFCCSPGCAEQHRDDGQQLRLSHASAALQSCM